MVEPRKTKEARVVKTKDEVSGPKPTWRAGLTALWVLVAAVVSLAAVAAILSTQGWFRDFWTGLWYSPTGEMAQIRDDLSLTSDGLRVFNAAQPVLEKSEEFNAHCRSHESSVLVLGCYTDERIYVYEITAEELLDANRSTTAHELLHAVWARMGEGERDRLTPVLLEVWEQNKAALDENLARYEEKERVEEVWTRAATTLRDLPEELEGAYGKYFADRAKIVSFYENYQAPFRKLEEENDKLKQKIAETKREIVKARGEYQSQVKDLKAKIEQFNYCAGMAGCFVSDADFSNRKSVLLAKQQELDALRETLNTRISENNERIEEYRKNEEKIGRLSNLMNSNVETKEEKYEGI